MASDLPERMPAITVWQPYASLIMAGLKPFEFRDWWHNLDGRLIAIHAGTRRTPDQEVTRLLYWLSWRRGAPFCGVQLDDEQCERAAAIIRMSVALPRGSLVGTVTLAPARAVSAIFDDAYGRARWTAKEAAGAKCGWPLIDPVRRQPAECQGRQKFFEVATPPAWLKESANV